MRLSILLLLIAANTAFAGSWSSAAVPTKVDIERGNGVMVYGDFGNAGSCTVANRVYIKKAHPQYDEIYATILLAFSAEKKLTFYVSNCEGVSWYAVLTTTFNIVNSSDSVTLSN